MTLYIRRSFPILAVASGWVVVSAAHNGFVTWSVLAPVALSSAVMLWALLERQPDPRSSPILPSHR